MCFSKRRKKSLKLKILSTTTESVLLFIYLSLYPYVLYVVNSKQSSFYMRQNLLFYFGDPFTEPQKQENWEPKPGAHTLDGIYDFTERLLVDKLWQGEDRTTRSSTVALNDNLAAGRRELDLMSPLVDPSSAKVFTDSQNGDVTTDTDSADDQTASTSQAGTSEEEGVNQEVATQMWKHPYWPVGAVRLGQFRLPKSKDGVNAQVCTDPTVDPMVRFMRICNRPLVRNTTEATDDYDHISEEPLDRSRCFTADCKELEYSSLEMGFEGQYGRYPSGGNYGTFGYYMDFKGADHEDMRRKLDYLKETNWIDQFTQAVAVKWTILNQWDGLFYSVNVLCESPGLNIRHCEHSIETVSFPERSFEARITDDGRIKVEHGISSNKIFPSLMFIALMLFANLFYTAKIALEMNLGFSITINALEFLHILIVEVALVCYFLSTLQKRSFEVDLLDTSTFVDMSFIFTLDKYTMIAINVFMVFYPFRFFAFISRFNFSTAIKGTLNTVVRMSPGLCTYFTIVFIISIAIAISSMLLLGSHIPEFNTFIGAYVITMSVNFFDLPSIRDLVSQPSQPHYAMIAFAFQQLMKFSMVICIALAVYLFAKAVTMEKSIAFEPEEEDQTEYIEEIHEKVSQLYSLSLGGSESHSGTTTRATNRLATTDKYYTNTKIVAWLTNRPVEEDKHERDMFFNKLNSQIQKQYNAQLEQQMNPFTTQQYQSVNKQDDANEVSMISQNLTGRTPTQHLSQYMGASGLTLGQQKPQEDETTQNELINSTMQRGIAQAQANKENVIKNPFEIVPIEFETVTKLKLFLESLFQLKPNLLTSYSLDKFRIVVEISQEMNTERILKAFNSLERTISQLNEFGCKVPVLVYADIPLSTQQNNRIQQLKKKYIMLFYTKSIFEVAKFCKMDQLVKT